MLRWSPPSRSWLIEHPGQLIHFTLRVLTIRYLSFFSSLWCRGLSILSVERVFSFFGTGRREWWFGAAMIYNRFTRVDFYIIKRPIASNGPHISPQMWSSGGQGLHFHRKCLTHVTDVHVFWSLYDYKQRSAPREGGLEFRIYMPDKKSLNFNEEYKSTNRHMCFSVLTKRFRQVIARDKLSTNDLIRR